MTTRRIEVPVLTRVEGEGALHVRIEGRAITDLRLRIFEPPRFFEKFLEGRTWKEVPDVTARICGICPVAYQMSAVHAIEKIFGAAITPEIRDLRRLYYCGEWIESHALHIHLLAAPDFFGYPDAIAMAREYPTEVKRGMHLQAIGNDLVKLLGGRPVNPVGARPGGFYRAPEKGEVDAMLKRCRDALPAVAGMVRWTAGVKVPEVIREVPWVAMRHPDEYPMNEGRIVSDTGLDIDAEDFEKHFTEFQAPHSTALHAHLDGQPYWVGPVPRLNLNLDRLPPETEKLLRETGVAWPSPNPYHGMLARAIEVHVAFIEAIRILERYRRPAKGYVEVTPRAGTAAAVTEAPRGILWHRYTLDERGDVVHAHIVPPTSQNQAAMEADLYQSVQEALDLDDAALTTRLEAAIRNYDPCISCATHFLKLTVERT
ncbi:MAG: Ni/Fe hydrogenase subunit alpha [Gammaproteobacteria bacterium]